MELVLQRPQRKESVKKYSVLYVDDEPVNLRIFQHAFKRDYNIYTALNGFDALEILNEKEVDLIITDQQMPRMSGVDLLAKIVPKHPNIVRMIMTGFSDIGAIIRAVNEFGLDKYLVKPWDRDQLKVEFDKALDKKDKENKAKTSTPTDDSVIKLNETFLPKEAELQELVKDSFVIFDNTVENRSSYGFIDKGEEVVISFFSTGTNNSSAVALKSFTSLCLTQIVYQESSLDPTIIINALEEKLKSRYKGSSEAGTLDISVVVLNKKTGEIKFAGVNQNIYYFDSTQKLKMLNGLNESLDLNSTDVKGLRTTISTDALELYFISKSVLNQILPNADLTAEGISFLQFMRGIRQLPMAQQSEEIHNILNGDNSKCIIGIRMS